MGWVLSSRGSTPVAIASARAARNGLSAGLRGLLPVLVVLVVLEGLLNRAAAPASGALNTHLRASLAVSGRDAGLVLVMTPQAGRSVGPISGVRHPGVADLADTFSQRHVERVRAEVV